MNNCRNCGAPHNSVKCGYCGTIYTGTQKAKQVKAFALPKPKVKPTLTWKGVLFIVLVPVAIVICYYIFQHFVKRSRK